MNKYSVYLTPQALEQLKNIGGYIADILMSPTVANNVIDRIEFAINQLDLFPNRCSIFDVSPWKEIGMRRLVVDTYNAYYFVNEDNKTVTIVAITNSRYDQVKALNEVMCLDDGKVYYTNPIVCGQEVPYNEK